ncbi:hypothetical protein [Marinimicrobium locisalis]|uniref:hypothetical protein n=1 Tax=Marinimicrobium locisalis TaxID=546022 RepID=UPI0032218471
MPNFYEISSSHDSLTLKDGKGAASFSVRYVGERQVEARASAEPMENAKEQWLKVESPDQVSMEPGQTQTFKVGVEVPPGTPPGRYGLRLDVVSVDNTDEEYDRGPLVTFEVSESKPAPASGGFPWWAVIVAAVVLVLLVGGVVWWLVASDKPERDTEPVPEQEDESVYEPAEPAEPEEPVRVERSPDERGSFVVSQTWSGDFDLGREVPRGAPRSQADFWFQAKTATDRMLVPKNNGSLALLRVRGTPNLNEVKTALRSNTVRELDVNLLAPQRWFAARTSEGNWVAFTPRASVGASPGEFQVVYLLWENR